MPLFTTATVDGQRRITGVEPIFNSRLNPGNLLVRIHVSRYWNYYVVRSCCPGALRIACGVANSCTGQ